MAHSVLLLLSEVERLAWMDLHADAFYEVLVRDLPVAILVKEVEDCVALRLRQRETPVLNEKDQLIFINVRVVVLIKVFECLSDGAPLLPYFFDELAEHDAVRHNRFGG